VGGHAQAGRPQVGPEAVGAGGPGRVVRVLPDAPAIDKEFDYVVPPALDREVRVGTLVRVVLHGRRVGGWVVADDVEPRPGVVLRPVAKVTGWGPAPEVVDLARWAAWRWAGRPAHLLRTASPPSAVRGLPPADPGGAPASTVVDPLAQRALEAGRAVVRLPPAADVLPLVVAAAAGGTTLVVTATGADAASLASRLRRTGLTTALLPGEWARAAAGAPVVVGARGAVWGPAVGLACVVVVDEHADAHQEEAAPTWHAREVAVERARRAGARCVLTSPCPSLEAQRRAAVVAPPRPVERRGWPAVDVVDRRREDPLRADLYSSPLVDLVRSGRTVACVLNRKGRHRLLACAACAELARCEACGAAVSSGADGELACGRCATRRPPVCLACGAGRLKVRRLGVSRAREDLERLAGVPVVEVTADTAPQALPSTGVVVGTEAVLHRLGRADAVAFLDLDAELLAPRHRAAEEALALLARAARLVGGRADGGRLLLQTRLPQHEVVQAAVLADPERVSTAEAARREALRFPPVTALASLSGGPAAAYADALRAVEGLEVLGPVQGSWLVRAPDHRRLCDALAATPRPPGRLRVAVDPRRL
jgi:primosomal protein N' (replication factor Y) (superfamily II helicase)